MIEVVFNESTKGSMKTANNTNKDKKNLYDEVSVGNSLDIGNISDGFNSVERQHFFKKICSQFNFSKDEQEYFFKVNA